jgi:hypothetical protein
MLCGMSLQPILVSLSIARPKAVLIVRSTTEDGEAAARELERICRNDKSLCGLRFLETVEVHPADPAHAYTDMLRAVRNAMDAVRADVADVVVDITGGKKTMVAAAFLVATHLGIRTQYVDGAYDAEARLPVPCTASVEVLDDPVMAFRLRDLAEAATHFRQCRFDMAARLFREASSACAASRHAHVLPHSVREIETAAACAEACGCWMAGDIVEARDVFAKAHVPVPGRLEALARRWQPRDCRLRRLSAESHGEGLLRFAADRLSWACRVSRAGDLRDGYLRAYSACEVAVDGLVMALLRDERWKVREKPKCKSYRDVCEALTEKHVPSPERAASEALSDGKSCPPLEVSNCRGLGDALREFSKDENRAHRNALVHGVGELDVALARALVDGSESLAVQLLLAVSAELGLGKPGTEWVKEALEAQDVESLPAGGFA